MWPFIEAIVSGVFPPEKKVMQSMYAPPLRADLIPCRLPASAERIKSLFAIGKELIGQHLFLTEMINEIKYLCAVVPL